MWSALLGTLVEYYDFYLYSLLAAVAIGPLFFPGADPAAALLASFATLAVGFVARPLGALLMTAVGDRLGRRRVLLVTVLAMGIASLLIGLLPPYSTMGVWAPILLVALRVVQGLAAGGEFGGGLLMSVEYARDRRRGLASSAPQVGLYAGIILANASLLLVTLLPREDFLGWGWRLPFFFSLVLVALTLWVRAGVDETPVFEKAKRAHELAKRPLTDLFRTQWRALGIVVLAAFVVTTASALNSSFNPAYAIQLGFTSSQALTITLLGTATGLLFVPLFAGLSDRWGRKRLAVGGIVLIPVTAWAAFEALGSGRWGLAILAAILPAIAHSMAFGPLGAWIAELFPTRFRYGGASIGFQLAATLGAGFFPLIATGLSAAAGGAPHYGLVLGYLVVAAAISLVGVRLARETSTSTFDEIDATGKETA
ncbi:MFS transporter [Pseudonocardia kujensis]|uniref:MFS transporter n=1 Tax=Pseudonocardia kujensis TaxID=1128675 RepID=UPI001E479218|nr:MFS transporter [Pseudonocardia kujensis]